MTLSSSNRILNVKLDMHVSVCREFALSSPRNRNTRPFPQVSGIQASKCHQGVIKEADVAFARKRGRSWYAYWDEYEDGKRVTRAQSWGRDKKAAEDFVLLKNADRIRGVQEPSKQTLHSFWKTYEDEKIPSLTE